MANVQQETEQGKGKKDIWFVCFESVRLASAGGLGDAVANLSETLSNHARVTLFIPSHGRHSDNDIKQTLGLSDTGLSFKGERIGYDGSKHPYMIGVEEGRYLGVRYFVFKGLDPATAGLLQNRSIYGDELTYQKASLLARGVRAFAKLVLQRRQLDEIPDIIHMHDWHSVPAGISAWQAFNERRVYPALVFSVHLLSFRKIPWHYVSEQWSGLRDQGHYISSGGAYHFVDSFRTVWESMSDGSFEKFGSNEADFVTTVSGSYLADSLLPYLGKGAEGKSSYVYNGCDWNHAAMMDELVPRFRGEVTDTLSRRRLRAFVLGSLLPTLKTPDNASLKPLRDGPLVLATGRADRQKGMDLLLDAVPEVLKILPSAKFLVLLLPTDDANYQESLKKKALGYRENVALVIGNTSGIYKPAYLASDIYAMPSRWEPFGITALEAMATGNPVVGSCTGGIRESVVDLSVDTKNGTGLLVNPEDRQALAGALASLLVVMEADGADARTRTELSNEASLEFLRTVVAVDGSFGSRLRVTCVRRVQENFTWKHSAARMELCYDRAIRYAKERSSAWY